MSDADLNAALAAAQGEFPEIKRSKTVKTGSYEYSYAPLERILDGCRPALAKQGLAIVQLLEQNEHGPALRTELRHKTGAMISSSFPLPTVPAKAQELGSLLTYLRRYAIVALLGIATEDDDDGQAAPATRPTRKRQPARKEEPPPPPAEPDPGFYTPKRILPRQLTRLSILFREKGIEDRQERLSFCRTVVGRELSSSKDLGQGEASEVIKALERYDKDDPQSWPFPAGY